MNGKPDKIYKLLQSNEGIEFLQQHGIDPEETEGRTEGRSKSRKRQRRAIFTFFRERL